MGGHRGFHREFRNDGAGIGAHAASRDDVMDAQGPSVGASIGRCRMTRHELERKKAIGTRFGQVRCVGVE